MLRYKDILADEGVARRRPQPRCKPRVPHRQRRGGHQDQCGLGGLPGCGAQHGTAAQPVRVQGTGGKGPLPGHPPAVGHPPPGGGRRDRGADPRVRVLTEHLGLRARRKLAHQPAAHQLHAQLPGGGAVRLTEHLRNLDEGTQLGLVAAEAARGEQPEQTRVGERIDDLVGYSALRLCSIRVLPYQRPQGGGPRHQLGTARNARNGLVHRLPGGGHVVLLERQPADPLKSMSRTMTSAKRLVNSPAAHLDGLSGAGFATIDFAGHSKFWAT